MRSAQSRSADEDGAKPILDVYALRTDQASPRFSPTVLPRRLRSLGLQCTRRTWSCPVVNFVRVVKHSSGIATCPDSFNHRSSSTSGIYVDQARQALDRMATRGTQRAGLSIRKMIVKGTVFPAVSEPPSDSPWTFWAWRNLPSRRQSRLLLSPAPFQWLPLRLLCCLLSAPTIQLQATSLLAVCNTYRLVKCVRTSYAL